MKLLRFDHREETTVRHRTFALAVLLPSLVGALVLGAAFDPAAP